MRSWSSATSVSLPSGRLSWTSCPVYRTVSYTGRPTPDVLPGVHDASSYRPDSVQDGTLDRSSGTVRDWRRLGI